MNKQQYLKSFLKPGQKRLPRKLKKKFSKYYRQGGPLFVLNQTQFLNLYIKKDNECTKNAINNLLHTPLGEVTYIPACGVDFNVLKNKNKELYEKACKPNVTVELTDISTSTPVEVNNCKGYVVGESWYLK